MKRRDAYLLALVVGVVAFVGGFEASSVRAMSQIDRCAEALHEANKAMARAEAALRRHSAGVAAYLSEVEP